LRIRAARVLQRGKTGTLGVTVLRPPQIDPKNKAMIDAYLEVEGRYRSRKAWQFWLFVAATSIAALYLVRYEWLPQVVRLGLAIVGGIGLLLFLAFLSTKPFGRGYYAGPSWWPLLW
jgi:hypothetical protein